jgi:hypothetical protein
MYNNLTTLPGQKKQPPKRLAAKSRWVLLGLAASAFVAIVVWIDLQPVFTYRAIKSRVKALIPLGSDIDAAEAVLTDAGLQFYEKALATVKEDYYVVEVKIHYERRSIVADALGHLHIYLYYNYVVIEAGLDNKVRKIF